MTRTLLKGMPHKRLDIFEGSGHGMIWQETDKFHDIMINTVVPEMYQNSERQALR